MIEMLAEIFMGYDFTEGRLSHFPIDCCMGLITVQRYCAAYDLMIIIITVVTNVS